MNRLSGKKIAEDILSRIQGNIAQGDRAPVFAALLVGDDPASHIYVNLKERAALSVGIEFRKIILPETVFQDDLLAKIALLNADQAVSGILVQLPLPEHIDTQVIIDALDPSKDVDGFHPDNIQLFLEGKERLAPVFPRAIMELVTSAGIPLEGKRAVVIGNSDVFGQMMLTALSRVGVEGVFVRQDAAACRKAQILSADIVVTAVGIPNFVTGDMVKPGAIVIDGGIAKVGDKVVGDVDISSMQDKDVLVSPVPGGVGPVTIACLLENVFLAAQGK
ncbi:MAG: bifunctional 5,10-methylenetetrahydrofolate dehydrogenase/5,10-methenyltetrahydrofolate cyclohydrolase [Candidatus Moranbacteria bacterium]|nr:bifunctional 5,10-methylenetetrahydrofolate dehydrogenase/5,10-methenyltetrahydrofolate cyclohydrolase [Candidatus Moranbacteria bacterium]